MAIVIYGGSQVTQESDRCVECHQQTGASADIVRHPLVAEGVCLACHRSYDEETHVEDEKPEMDICQECHSAEDLGRSHPVGPGIVDPKTNGMMTCVSTCHHPHGTPYKYFLPFANNMELCLSCHENF